MIPVYILATIFIVLVETAPQQSSGVVPQDTSNIGNAASNPSDGAIPNSQAVNPAAIPSSHGNFPNNPGSEHPPFGNQPANHPSNYFPVPDFNGNPITSGNPITDFMNFIMKTLSRPFTQPIWPPFTPTYR